MLEPRLESTMRAHSKILGPLYVSLALLAFGCSTPPSEVSVSTLGPPASTSEGSTSGDASADDSGTDDGSDTSDSDDTNGTGPTFDPICGDGIIEGDEECDLGPQNGQNEYCTGECRANVCGDGYLGPGEACDDGNNNNNDQCTTQCGLASCGDGAIQAGEECDDGNANSQTGACLPSCILASCGDLFIQAGVESCDGINTSAETCMSQGFDRGVLECSPDCTTFDTSNCHLCGNMVVEPNEVCDPPDFQGLDCSDYAPGGTTVSSGTISCTNACTNIDSSACTFCGDDVVEGPAEECDNANLAGLGCADFAPGGATASAGSLLCNNCVVDSTGCTHCNDGMIEGAEQCEPGNLNGQDCASQGATGGTLACGTTCMFDTSSCYTCGDGVQEPPEDCDMLDLAGGSCSTLGAGYGGDVSCDVSCAFDYSACCLMEGETCIDSSECCSNNCAGTCMPMK